MAFAIVAGVEYDVSTLIRIAVDHLVDEELQRLQGHTFFADRATRIGPRDVEHDVLVIVTKLDACVELHAIENALSYAPRILRLFVVRNRSSGTGRTRRFSFVTRFAIVLYEQRTIHVVSTLVHDLSSQGAQSLRWSAPRLMAIPLLCSRVGIR